PPRPPTTTAPMARATRSPAGARRSTVMAAPTTASARRWLCGMTYPQGGMLARGEGGPPWLQREPASRSGGLRSPGAEDLTPPHRGQDLGPVPIRYDRATRAECRVPGNRLRPLHMPGHLRTVNRACASWKFAAAASRSPRVLERGGAFPCASVSG